MMKALTIWQPWAGMVAAGIKRNETRSWGTNYRGQIAIHAAKQDIHIGWCRYLSDEAAEVICRRLDLPEVFNAVKAFPTGCVLATANLVECIKITPEFIATLSLDELALGDYTLGRYAWKMADVKQLSDPIPARGRQGLWEWEG
jgi:hypothetical protein